jgi:rhodanese-related sulfurtransferase
MLKTLISSLLILSATYAEIKPTILHDLSVEISYTTPDGKVKKVTIARDMDLRCRQIPFNAREYWEGNYASRDVADFCKKTFITTAGKIAPMKMHDKVETYGELEVLDFLEDMQDDKELLFVDSRKPQWYESVSIPSAINIPFTYFTDSKNIKFKQEALIRFGVKSIEGGYEFTHAKTILFFCNGVWCRQSPQMIEALLALGYPPQKMKWYRGGMQSWLSLGMTSTRSPQ